jgi:hypothetical protein
MWIMIIILWGQDGPSVSSIEFNNQLCCEKAMGKMLELLDDPELVDILCVPKGIA